MKRLPTQLQCTKVRCSTLKVVVDSRQTNTRVNSSGPRPQPKIKSRRVIEPVRWFGRIRPGRFFKDAGIKHQAVHILSRCAAICRKVRKIAGFEALGIIIS